MLKVPANFRLNKLGKLFLKITTVNLTKCSVNMKYHQSSRIGCIEDQHIVGLSISQVCE